MHAPSVAHVLLVIIYRLLSILVMYCSALLHRFRDWFLASMAGVQRHLLRHSQPSQLMFIGEEMESRKFYAKMASCTSMVFVLNTLPEVQWNPSFFVPWIVQSQ